MIQVTGILVQIVTDGEEWSGTNGSVYLGLGGREFCLDTSKDDRERGSIIEYLLGWGPFWPGFPDIQFVVSNFEQNDPNNGYPMEWTRFEVFPRYIRFEPKGPDPDWKLAYAALVVYNRNAGGSNDCLGVYTIPKGFTALWLGDSSGKVLHFTESVTRVPFSGLDPTPAIERGREIAGVHF